MPHADNHATPCDAMLMPQHAHADVAWHWHDVAWYWHDVACQRHDVAWHDVAWHDWHEHGMSLVWRGRVT